MASSIEKKSMERPMDGINNVNINPMSSIPGKTIQYFVSTDEFDKGYNYPQSSIGFDEIKYSWNSRVFHTRGSDKNWNGPMSETTREVPQLLDVTYTQNLGPKKPVKSTIFWQPKPVKPTGFCVYAPTLVIETTEKLNCSCFDVPHPTLRISNEIALTLPYLKVM